VLEIFNSPETPGLIANIIASVGGTTIINGLIFGLGWSSVDKPALLDSTVLPAFTPPGYAFGIIWTVLFALMGTARWFVGKGTDLIVAQQHQQLVLILIVFCLVQPLYSTAINSRFGGILGTVGAVILSVFTLLTIRNSSEVAALLVIPVSIWTIYASFLLIAVIRSRGW
jgi:translocator protein